MLINERLISINYECNDKDQAMEAVAQLFEADGRLFDREKYINDLHAREDLVTTSLGFSFAIPHAKSGAVKEPSLAFIKLKDEISWNETDQVKFVFGIGVPIEDSGDTHLKILAKLARKMMDETFRERLYTANSSSEYLEIITFDPSNKEE
ncbi:MAG: fructose PTS transporter subunit IIA [Clostridiaceae bacterium]